MTKFTWSGPPVQVIGLGVDIGDTLGRAARTALAQAEVVIAASRHLKAFAELQAELLGYPSPMEDLWPLLQARSGKRIVLLASGDPLFYGIGASLLRELAPEQIIFQPHISSIQAAFARVKKSWQDAHIVSLHGRPLASLHSVLKANSLYALLTDRVNNPVAIATVLTTLNFGDSALWVAEDLGAPYERVRSFRAAALADTETEFSPLNVVIVETRGPGGIAPEFPGIPDEQFLTGEEPGKGLLSKREVRLCVLSLLAPRAGEIGWDVGAGCGGVAVEWALWNARGQVYAVECDADRLRYLTANRELFGVEHNLHIVAGQAPEALTELPEPHAVFVGGSKGKLDDLLQTAWARLALGGRLVASAVTEDSRMDLYRFAGNKPAYWTELSIARADRLAGQRVLRPYLPVLLMRLEKRSM